MAGLALLVLCLSVVSCGGDADQPPAPPTLSLEAKAGETVFIRECARCHSTVDDAVIVGPSLAGIATQAGGRVPDQDAQTYLLTSIMQPGDYLVEGYQDLMPQALAKSLTGEEIDGVIAYLMTLR